MQDAPGVSTFRTKALPALPKDTKHAKSLACTGRMHRFQVYELLSNNYVEDDDNMFRCACTEMRSECIRRPCGINPSHVFVMLFHSYTRTMLRNMRNMLHNCRVLTVKALDTQVQLLGWLSEMVPAVPRATHRLAGGRSCVRLPQARGFHFRRTSAHAGQHQHHAHGGDQLPMRA